MCGCLLILFVLQSPNSVSTPVKLFLVPVPNERVFVGTVNDFGVAYRELRKESSSSKELQRSMQLVENPDQADIVLEVTVAAGTTRGASMMNRAVPPPPLATLRAKLQVRGTDSAIDLDGASGLKSSRDSLAKNLLQQVAKWIEENRTVLAKVKKVMPIDR